jgi:hypothetical protein
MVAFLALAVGMAKPANAEPGAPQQLGCSAKSYPNLVGQNAVILRREPGGGYIATYEAHGPAKTKKGLRCVFDANPLVFACTSASGAWGLYSKKLDERSISSTGKAEDAHVYEIDAVKTPEGEPRTESEFRFELSACRAGS